MAWLIRLIEAVIGARTAGGMLGEAVPPDVQEAVTNLLGQAPVQDLLRQAEQPAQWLEAVPRDPSGFVDGATALLKERLKFR